MEQKEEQLLNQNTLDIAVLNEKIGRVDDHVTVLDEKVDTIMNNHLVHISDDIKTVMSTQNDHSQKFVEFDLAKKLIFGAVVLILLAAMGQLTFTIFR